MSVVSTQGVNVKCRAMYSRLLGRADYDALIKMKSVSQIAAYLKKQTPYAYVLRRIDEHNVHRGQLEQVFKRSLYYDYGRLLKFTTGGYKAAVRAMFESYEVEDLKLVIGSICSDRRHSVTLNDLTYISAYSEFPASSVLGAATIAELAANLRHTRYYKALMPFAAVASPDFIKIDHALNLLNYRAKMNVFKKTLSGASKRVAVSLYGTQADLENILYIYRIKKLYRLPASEILIYLIPCEYRIRNRELLGLAECDDVGSFIGLVRRTFYGFLFPAGRESEWESIHTEYFYQLHRRNLRVHGGDVGVAFSYLFMKETDIKNIIMIIEGVRYALPAERITSFLTGYGPEPRPAEQRRGVGA